MRNDLPIIGLVSEIFNFSASLLSAVDFLWEIKKTLELGFVTFDVLSGIVMAQ